MHVTSLYPNYLKMQESASSSLVNSMLHNFDDGPQHIAI